MAKRKVHQTNPAIRNREWARMFFDAAKNPSDWHRVAQRLRSSADVIFEPEKPVAAMALHKLQRLVAKGRLEELDTKEYAAPNIEAGYMLMAFAIENLLKGLIVGKGTVDASNPDRLFDELLTHNLADLHNLAEPKATIATHLLCPHLHGRMAGTQS